MKVAYRSPGTPRGIFNTLGSIHIHIDGSRDLQGVERMVKQLESRGHPGKFNHVHAFIAGSQREILPEVYQSHTPAPDGEESLEFFSTTLLRDRFNAINVLRIVALAFENTPGIIAELEQVIARFDSAGWSKIDEAKIEQQFGGPRIKFRVEFSLPFEIHHGFELPKEEGPPLSLPELLDFCKANQIQVGGWFIFEKEHTWAYRSNSFADHGEWRTIVEREHQAISGFLKGKGLTYSVSTNVEKVIALWKARVI